MFEGNHQNLTSINQSTPSVWFRSTNSYRHPNGVPGDYEGEHMLLTCLNGEHLNGGVEISV